MSQYKDILLRSFLDFIKVFTSRYLASLQQTDKQTNWNLCVLYEKWFIHIILQGHIKLIFIYKK